MRVTVNVNTRRAQKKMRTLVKKSEQRGAKTVADLANLGKRFAKSIVPVFSGRTYRSIRKRVLRRKGGPEAKVYVYPTVLKDGHNRQIQNFELVRWMHQPKNRGHFRSGEPQFMYKTRDYLNKMKKKVAQGNYKNINIR